eukprot:7133164-Prymnesium_polylepis.2
MRPEPVHGVRGSTDAARVQVVDRQRAGPQEAVGRGATCISPHTWPLVLPSGAVGERARSLDVAPKVGAVHHGADRGG